MGRRPVGGVWIWNCWMEHHLSFCVYSGKQCLSPMVGAKMVQVEDRPGSSSRPIVICKPENVKNDRHR